MEKIKNPNFVTSFTQKVKADLGSMYLTVNEVDGKPVELLPALANLGTPS